MRLMSASPERSPPTTSLKAWGGLKTTTSLRSKSRHFLEILSTVSWSPTSKVGYIDNEGMKRGSTRKPRIARAIVRELKKVLMSSFTSGDAFFHLFKSLSTKPSSSFLGLGGVSELPGAGEAALPSPSAAAMVRPLPTVRLRRLIAPPTKADARPEAAEPMGKLSFVEGDAPAEAVEAAETMLSVASFRHLTESWLLPMGTPVRVGNLNGASCPYCAKV
mmetsp:Transcript_58326/g.126079  ORF Transcript_58326/g.126079 Transcript_58326/m.126079 type:complete len:219 (+) Transcript_58326:430-1086(+)